MPSHRKFFYKPLFTLILLFSAQKAVYGSIDIPLFVIPLEELMSAKRSLKVVEEHQMLTYFQREQLKEKLHAKELKLQHDPEKKHSSDILKEFSGKISFDLIMQKRKNLKKTSLLNDKLKAEQDAQETSIAQNKFSTQSYVKELYAEAGFARFTVNNTEERRLGDKLNNLSFYALINYYYSKGRGNGLVLAIQPQLLEDKGFAEKEALIDHFNASRKKYASVMEEIKTLTVHARTAKTKSRPKIINLIPNAEPLDISDFLTIYRYVRQLDTQKLERHEYAKAVWVFKVLGPLGKAIIDPKRKPLISPKSLSKLMTGTTKPEMDQRISNILEKMRPRRHFLVKDSSATKGVILKENADFLEEVFDYVQLPRALPSYISAFKDALEAVAQPIKLRPVSFTQQNQQHDYMAEDDYNAATILEKMRPRRHFLVKVPSYKKSVALINNPIYRTEKLNYILAYASLPSHISVFNEVLAQLKGKPLFKVKQEHHALAEDLCDLTKSFIFPPKPALDFKNIDAPISEPIMISPRRKAAASAPVQTVSAGKGGWWPWSSAKPLPQKEIAIVKVDWKPLKTGEPLKGGGQNIRVISDIMAGYTDWQAANKHCIHNEEGSYLIWPARFGLPEGVLDAEIEVITPDVYEEEISASCLEKVKVAKLTYQQERLKKMEEQKKENAATSAPIQKNYSLFKLW